MIYYLLSGELPFFRDNDLHRFQAIKDCDWNFDPPIFQDISAEAKDLITKLLVRDPSKRLSAKQILEHEWVKKNLKSK